MELVDGLEPPDLLITNQLLYQLSYTSILDGIAVPSDTIVHSRYCLQYTQIFQNLWLAGRVGFEPMLRSTRTTPLAGEPLKPLEYLPKWLRGQDSNLRPSAYGADELPTATTPQYNGDA